MGHRNRFEDGGRGRKPGNVGLKARKDKDSPLELPEEAQP